MIDLGVITHTCTCGSDTWKVLVTFDEFEIATYSTDMYCASCGNYARTPTPIDNPGFSPDNYVTS